MLDSKNLILIPVEQRHKAAFAQGKPALAALLEVTIPEGWPEFPQAFAPSPHDVKGIQPGVPHFGGYFFIHRAAQTLVGNGGFKGPPDALGVVEIGYEIAKEHQGRGFASEAAGAMIDFAFTQPSVTAVAAQTLPEVNASNRVLQRLGMERYPDDHAAPDARVWTFRISRARHAQRSRG